MRGVITGLSQINLRSFAKGDMLEKWEQQLFNMQGRQQQQKKQKTKKKQNDFLFWQVLFSFLLMKYKIHYMTSLQAHTYPYNIHALSNQYNNITPINPLSDIICIWAWLKTVFFPYLEILQIIRFKAVLCGVWEDLT